MENTEFMKNLKTGDKVGVSDYTWCNVVMALHTVKTVTPAGKIRLDNGVLYTPEGREIGASYHMSYLVSISEYNEWLNAKNDKIKKENLIKEISEKLAELTTEKLEEIAKNIKEME